MDELKELFLEVFTKEQGIRSFEKPSPERRYKAFTITASAGEAEGTDHEELELTEDALVDYMASPSPEDQKAQPLPRLQLIRLEKGSDYRWMIDIEIFKGLLSAASISAEGSWTVLQGVDCLHSVRRLEDTDSHFAGHTWYSMAWSFNRRSLCTKVIWVDNTRSEEYRRFMDLLWRFQKYISSPLPVGYLYCLGATIIDLAKSTLSKN